MKRSGKAKMGGRGETYLKYMKNYFNRSCKVSCFKNPREEEREEG